MTLAIANLVERLRRHPGPLFYKAVWGDQWDELRMQLELGQGNYVAVPVGDLDALHVITSAEPLGGQSTR